MAGETPGAANAGKRRKLPWADDKSTNKVYASGDISALGDYQTVADSTLKPGQTPGANPTPTQRADDKSADKYYANGGSARVRTSAPVAGQKKLGPPPALGVVPKAKPPAFNPNAQLLITAKDQINGVLDAVVNKLNGGQSPVVLYVAAGENQLLKRTRAGLEMLVTREVITEEQYHDVRLSYEPKAEQQAEIAAKLGVPTAATTKATEDNEAVNVDPMAFLNGDDDGDEKVDVESTAATEVDTTGDVASSPAPSHPTAGGDDEDDNDFLSPKDEPPATDTILTTVPVESMDGVGEAPAEAAAETPAAETPAAEEAPAETTDGNLPRRRGKRSGRGAD